MKDWEDRFDWDGAEWISSAVGRQLERDLQYHIERLRDELCLRLDAPKGSADWLIGRRIDAISDTVCEIGERVGTVLANSMKDERLAQHKMQELADATAAMLVRNTGRQKPVGYFIYALFRHGESTPVYVGQSKNWAARIGKHVTDKDFDEFVVVDVGGELAMHEIESRLIKKYRPEYNKQGNPAHVGLQKEAAA